ncbi:hypothetical protein GQ44DRAFT_801414 [Phaeosphaeriaceae sp. PMI808]|nr:hypothetical protein GQ44DRAFT_801414 [Phaeosphaeriaceae sp. PMI808]
MASILDLPIELTLMVTNYLQKEDFISLARVARGLQAPAQEALHRDVTLVATENSSQIFKLVATLLRRPDIAQRICRLKVRAPDAHGYLPEWFKWMVRRLRYLEHFDAAFKQDCMNDGWLPTWVCVLLVLTPRVRHLDIIACFEAPVYYNILKSRDCLTSLKVLGSTNWPCILLSQVKTLEVELFSPRYDLYLRHAKAISRVESLTVQCRILPMFLKCNSDYSDLFQYNPCVRRVKLIISKRYDRDIPPILCGWWTGSFAHLVGSLSPLQDTLEELDIRCESDAQHIFLHTNPAAATFRFFTRLKRLHIPFDVIDPLNPTFWPPPTIDEALPHSLQRLYIYNADHRFMLWCQDYHEAKSAVPELKTLCLDFCGYKMQDAEPCLNVLLFEFVEQLAQTDLNIEVYHNRKQGIEEKRFPSVRFIH